MSNNTIQFRVTGGPYGGDYDVDPNDLTGSEISRFRAVTGMALQSALQHGELDVDVFCGLVWLVRSRTSRGLAFQMVADNITRGQIEPLDEKPEDGLGPTSSGDG